MPSNIKVLLALVLFSAGLIAIVTWLGPSDAQLGTNLRLVLLHGVWVWAGKLGFLIAALTGLFALLIRRSNAAEYSSAIGLAATFLWITYLPMSLIVQVQNWGGIFWDEPRWKVPLMFGLVAVLLQLGLLLIRNRTLTAITNLLFGAGLWWKLGNIQNVLHPQDPVFSSDSYAIRIYFVALMALAILFGALLSRLILLIQRTYVQPSDA
ncbi:MAG TPA: hypothetical protein PKD55_20720 [Bellilinea sp.]|nr:hypothetical protein [Bellilinea sp.]